MHYVISFDVASLVVSLIIFIIHFNFYSKKDGGRTFQLFLLFIALNCATDIVSAWGIEQRFPVSDSVNMLLSTSFMFCMIMAHYYAFRSVAFSLKYKNKLLRKVNDTILALSIVALIINIFTGFMFKFVDCEYITTGLFFIIHAVCTWFMITLIIIIIANRHNIPTVKFHFSLFSIFALVIPVVIQLFLPSYLLISLGTTSIAFVLLFSLETPEYAKLQQAMLELENARSNEIEVRKQLEKSNEEKTAFLENMSHELRTPINAIMGFNKMIQLAKVDDDTMQKTIEIQNSGNRLLKLVGDILDFSQIETSRLDIRQEEYETIALYQINLRANENHIDSSIPRCLYGDINRIRQILDNLYNYGKGKSPDSCTVFKLNSLGIGDENVRLDFSLKFSSLKIDEKQIETVKQGSFSDELLPLAIAHKILTNMGSELKIFSGNKSGTVFNFELSQRIIDLQEIGDINAAVHKYEQNISREVEDLDFIAPTARILAVDDVKLNLKVLGGLLSKFKVQLATVTSGSEAVRFMEENEVDLVFMDIMMPEMNGVETLHAIKSNPATLSPDATIIAFTANVTVGARELYLSEGFDGYLSKPISVPKMGLTLKRFLGDRIESDWEKVMGIDAEGKAL